MAEAVFAALLRHALLLTVAVAVLWAARPLLRRLGAGATYGAWSLLPTLLLTALLPRPAQEPLRVVLAATGAPVASGLPGLPAPPSNVAWLWLAPWLLGIAVVLGLQCRRQWRLSRLGGRLPAGSSPALVGLLSPRVALPADFEQRFTPEEGELILAHEAVHRERLDNLWNLLACLLTAMHWWNPLLWWAQRRFRADQELACDAAVLASRPADTPTYSRALLAAHGLHAFRAPLASRWGSVHPLVERIAMLNRPRPLNRRRALLLAATVGTASALAYAADVQPPAGTGFIQLALKIERSQGDTATTTQTVRLIGKHGERMALHLSAVPAEKLNWTTEPLSISLRPRQTGGNEVLIETQIGHGEPSVVLGRPSVETAWGQKARIEIGDATTGEKFSLELTPTAAPADFKPSGQPSIKPPQ